MNIIDRLRLNLYPELKKLNLDDDILQQILSNKNFNNQYKNAIKPFLESLKEYKYQDFVDEKLKELNLDDETINQHLKAAFELSIHNNTNKYIGFVNEYYKQNFKISNYLVFNDKNFEQLYDLIGNDVFSDNISEVIKNGYSDRLIQFIGINRGNLNKLNSNIFEDKVWNVISQNPTLGDTSLLEMFKSKMDILSDLINIDLFDGLKYTYEAIPESHDFIKNIRSPYAIEQFSMEFISHIGQDTLKKLYSRHIFTQPKEFEKLFQITSYGNYKLIQDIVNYDSYNFSFNSILESDMQKDLLETNINYYNKSAIVLNKYLGIDKSDVTYIQLFLISINKVDNYPEEFREKYGSIIQLLNQVLSSNDSELLKICENLDEEKREEYKKLIYECEEYGNDILKQQFVRDLKSKNKEIVDTAKHKQVETKNGKNIDVYELNGEPFTMLVHAIANNKLSEHNSYVERIVNNPEEWEKIQDGSNNISTSLISDKHMITYGGIPNNNNILMFGFNNFPGDIIKFTNTSDAGIDRKAVASSKSINMRKWLHEPEVNTITTIDNLMDKSLKNGGVWNEVGMLRSDSNGVKIKPDYIVCMDYISENSIKAAEYFGIPIYLIERKMYLENTISNVEEMEVSEQIRR